MDYLRKIGDLLRRHYEKVILAVALIGLVYAVIHLNGQKEQEDEKIRDYNRKMLKRKTKEVPSVNLAEFSRALQNATNPPSLDFGLPHNLFNPVKWQRRPDGTIIKIETGTEVGPNALRIARVTPLSTIITVEKMSGSGLLMNVTQEASTNVYLRRRLQSYVTTNQMDRTKLFTLRSIGGTPENPQAIIELTSGERMTITGDKPFSRVDGYKADLTYPPENRNLGDRRVGDVLTIAGEDYIIVAITPNEVVVSARSNNRRTTIRNNAGP